MWETHCVWRPIGKTVNKTKKFVPNTADKLLTINDDDDDDWTLEKRRGGSVKSNL